MNRTELQQLTKIRVREAKVLLDNRCYAGAYYLLGYALECAFKSYIAKQTRKYDFPDKALAKKVFTHDLNELLKLSGLSVEHQKECRINRSFEANWTIVKDWSEESRYFNAITKNQAKELRSVVVSRRSGVLPWLQKWW